MLRHVFSPSALKIERFHRKTVQNRSVYFLKLPKMCSLCSIYNLYLICLLVWSFLILFSGVNDFQKCHVQKFPSLCSLPFARVEVDGFNKMTA